MAINRSVGALLLAMSALAPLPSSGQTDPAFETLSNRLRADDRIIVTVRDQRPVAGALVSLSDAALSVAVRGAVREFRVADIDRVDRVTHDGLKNGTLWGLAVGLGIGFFGLGQAANHIKLDDAETSIIVGLFVIPAAAAATGAAIDASITKKVPIYVRRRVGLSVSMASADRGAAVSVGAHLGF